MSQPTSPGKKRPRRLVIAIIFAFAIIAVGVTVWIIRQRNLAGFTIPTIRTDTNDYGVVEDVSLETAASPTNHTAAYLLMRLSEGEALPDDFPAYYLVTGEPLAEDEIAQILARLPELTGEPDDERPFYLPDELVPPPRPGTTISQPFPPPPIEAVPPIDVAPSTAPAPPT